MSSWSAERSPELIPQAAALADRLARRSQAPLAPARQAERDGVVPTGVFPGHKVYSGQHRDLDFDRRRPLLTALGHKMWPRCGPTILLVDSLVPPRKTAADASRSAPSKRQWRWSLPATISAKAALAERSSDSACTRRSTAASASAH